MIGRIARPYAQATLRAAGSPERAAETLGELRRLEQALAASVELRRAVANPAVPSEVRQRVVDQLAGKLSLGPLSRRLAALLLRNHRLGQLGEIADGLEMLVRRATGAVSAEVVTATELDPATRSALAAALGKAAGARVEMTTRIDPSLLAGFVAHIGSTVYDASLATRLERLSTRLARA